MQIQTQILFKKIPIVGAHWAADCLFLSRGCLVTSTVSSKNRQVSLMKQETISIIINWDVISTMHPPALASHTGIFRGARFSSLPTNACSTEDNIRFPCLANHIVLSKFWKVDLDRKVI